MSQKELRWWSSPGIHKFNGHPLQGLPFDKTISTDASLIGWGATWSGTMIEDRWPPQEATSHIDLLELKTGYLGLQAFFSLQNSVPKRVLLQMDNSTAVAYVNKKGGTRSLSLSIQALEVWALILESGSWITAKHIQGTSKYIADAASRQFNSHSEWTLNENVFHQVMKRFYHPTVDLFATRVNHSLPRYISRYPDPGAIATDAVLCN